jgi:hypothetical protein
MVLGGTMGYYINPRNCSKEEFLALHGEQLPNTPSEWDFSSYLLPVCLADNGPFTAAGICYDARELEDFARPDGRPKLWYAVSKEALKPYYDKAA